MRHTKYMKKVINKKNFLFFIPLLLIMVISFFTMYNARYMAKVYSNHLNKQIIWYFIAFLILFLFRKTKFLFKYSFWIYLINILLLLLVLFLGKEVNGARAWFRFGPFSFQPSEFMKLSYSLYLTKLIVSYKHKNVKTDFLFLLKIFILFLIPSVLIFLEPDTGAIVFLLIITLCMLFLSDIKKLWFILIFGLLFLLLSTFFYLFYFKQDLLIKLIGTSFFYRMDRILNFGTENNMQLENALIAIGNGHIFGLGLKNIAIYIPEAATDFAFALAISSFGFLSGFILLISYFLIDLYFLRILFFSKNKTTRLFTSGFIGVFVFSQFYNIFMNMGLVPIMGIPLPLLSYGGSALIVYFLYITIIINLDFKKV